MNKPPPQRKPCSTARVFPELFPPPPPMNIQRFLFAGKAAGRVYEQMVVNVDNKVKKKRA
jgi:hypothetical protein